jgi:hypothetical protein
VRRGAVGAAACAVFALVAVPAGATQSSGVTLNWVGDIAFSARQGLPAGSPSSVLAPVRRFLGGADLTTGNLEGTLGSGGPSKCARKRGNCFAFQAPASYARSLAQAGFGLFNLANNHSRDFGTSGIAQTLRALGGAGIEHTGLGSEVKLISLGGRRVAFLGFAPYPWTSPLTDIPAAKRLIASAAARAKIVVVFIHAGAEGSGALHVPFGTEHAFGENRGETRRFAREAIDAGADAVLGSGPHVLRGLECYKRRLIAFSLGNFVGYRTLSISGVLALSGVLRVRLGPAGELLGGHLFPLRLTAPGVPRPDLSGAGIRLVRSLSRSDFGARACGLSAAGDLALR